MRNAADYFGLMAYMFVMYGGLPDRDLLWQEESQGRRHNASGRGRRLQVIRGSKVDTRPEPEFEEAVA